MDGNRDFEHRLEECFSTLQQLTRCLAQFTSTSSPSARPQVATSAPGSTIYAQTSTGAMIPPATSSPVVSLATALPAVVSLAMSTPGTAFGTPTSSQTMLASTPSSVAPTVSASSSSGSIRPSQYLEHQRVFRSFRRSRRSTLPYARPQFNQWNQKFFCLASKDAQQIPMARAQKLALTSSGLGEKQLTISFNSTAEELHQALLNLYPPLRSCGGYDLLRGGQGSRMLIAIPISTGGYTPASLAAVVGQSRIYIRPLQRDLALASSSSGEMPREKCWKCLRTFPMSELRNHMRECSCSDDCDDFETPRIRQLSSDSGQSSRTDQSTLAVHHLPSSGSLSLASLPPQSSSDNIDRGQSSRQGQSTSSTVHHVPSSVHPLSLAPLPPDPQASSDVSQSNCGQSSQCSLSLAPLPPQSSSDNIYCGQSSRQGQSTSSTVHHVPSSVHPQCSLSLAPLPPLPPQPSYSSLEWSDSDSEEEANHQLQPIPLIPDYSKLNALQDMFPQIGEDKMLCLLDMLNGKVEQVVSVCLDMNTTALLRVLKFARMKTRVKRVTVNADTILRDALGLYKNTSFDIDRPLEVEFVGSEVVDLGGPRRQFFNVLIDGIKENRTLLLFEGEDYLLPCINHDAIIAGHYRMVGRMILHSILNEGPGFPFFPPPVYYYLVTGTIESALPHMDISHLPTRIRVLVEEIMQARNSDELKQPSLRDDCGELLEQSGNTALLTMDTRDAIVQNICSHELLIKRKTQLDQFSEGLSPLGFTNFLSTFGEELKCLFVRGMCRTLTTEDLLSLIVPVPKVPEQGAGSKTYEYLMTYVRNLNEMGRKQFLRFSTGSSVVPPLGLSPIKVSLCEDADAIYSSTCINSLKIPVFDHLDYNTFKVAMDSAIQEDTFTSM